MNKKIPQNLLILVLSLVTIACLYVTGWAVFLRPAQEPAAASQDYAPVELEPNAESIQNEEPASSAAEPADKGSGKVTIQFGDEVFVSRSTRSLSLNYANPNTSTHNVTVAVVLVDKNGTEVTIAQSGLLQSGLLQPGSALTRLDLDTEVNLPAGSYGGYFSLGFYDPASNEKATVDSHIDGLTIHVS